MVTGQKRLPQIGTQNTLKGNYTSTVQCRSRPESHLAPYVVDTGDINANGALVAGAEAAWVSGPFSLQANTCARG